MDERKIEWVTPVLTRIGRNARIAAGALCNDGSNGEGACRNGGVPTGTCSVGTTDGVTTTRLRTQSLRSQAKSLVDEEDNSIDE